MPKEIYKKYTVYTLDELTPQIQDKAIHNLTDYFTEDNIELFNDFLEYDLSREFPCSTLKYQYSLSYSQGDGVNIYGDILFKEIYRKIKNQLSEKSQKFMQFVFTVIDPTLTIHLLENRRYGYTLAKSNDFICTIIDTLVNDHYSGIKWSVLFRVNSLMQEYIYDLCKEYEKIGYNALYELNYETAFALCAELNIVFDEYGNIFNE